METRFTFLRSRYEEGEGDGKNTVSLFLRTSSEAITEVDERERICW
jgi:hypothetical protein